MTGTGASFLLRSTRKRRPTVRRPLPDGSYLTTVRAGKHRAGRGYGQLEVRIIEAWMTIELADGTRRTELWRLMTSLLDAESYPAHELITLYHRRWQAEICYFSLKSTILDGRVLRSRTVPGIEQEVYALLTVYQALVRTADDLVIAQSGLSAERVSMIVLLNAAAQIVAAGGIVPAGPVGLRRGDRPYRPGRPPTEGPAPATEGPSPQAQQQVHVHYRQAPQNSPDVHPSLRHDQGRRRP